MGKQQNLPPGQVETKKVLMRYIGKIPKIDLSTWKLIVYGIVKDSFSLTFEKF